MGLMTYAIRCLVPSKTLPNISAHLTVPNLRIDLIKWIKIFGSVLERKKITHLIIYSRTSVARTLMAHLPWLF